MVVKVYISGISGNKEVKKRQQRVLMILDSKNIKYEVIDITEPGKEDDKDFMQNNAKCNGGTVSDPNPRSPLPPQVFNDEEYCGDYDQFDMANEVDTLEQYLKLEIPSESLPGPDNEVSIKNGSVKESSIEKKYKNSNVDASEEYVNNEANEGASTNEEIQAANTELDENLLEEVENEDSENRLKPEYVNKSSKEIAPANDENGHENGVISSREPSNEKEEIQHTKENLSEALIESEKAVSTE
ncbi:SH3 domain-binding glutamic acid-rich protein homolog [Pieris brassicae]|uniref:SH3 domain-binding glutamic acid-rich protein n=1 Tax=Pieris brassicae TaxID=7116 RepID=A0A9P0X7V6_PIEBR|nr:SH3 domain-binding glutamic acid-rich protein homolog [Pieris brassicae]CAH4020315.1 unnamed protein product [Pieris brassicae]